MVEILDKLMARGVIYAWGGPECGPFWAQSEDRFLERETKAGLILAIEAYWVH
jgi:hypothetical protein